MKSDKCARILKKKQEANNVEHYPGNMTECEMIAVFTDSYKYTPGKRCF